MDVIHTESKGKMLGEMLDTIEKFYIYNETRINNQIYDTSTVKPHVIFETLILAHTDRAHTTLYHQLFPHTPQSRVLITRRRTQATALQI